jgi:hypothetical protein
MGQPPGTDGTLLDCWLLQLYLCRSRHCRSTGELGLTVVLCPAAEQQKSAQRQPVKAR